MARLVPGRVEQSKCVRCALVWAAVTLVTGCSSHKASRPDAHALPVSTTAIGLADFFDQVCLQQRHRDWVVREASRAFRECGSDDDCLLGRGGHLSWEEPTANGSTLVVSLKWPQKSSADLPPPGKIRYCTISVAEDVGDELADSVRELSVRGYAIGKIEYQGPSASYDRMTRRHLIDAAGKHVIWIGHYQSPDSWLASRKLKAADQGKWPINDRLYYSYLQTHSAHPWELTVSFSP